VTLISPKERREQITTFGYARTPPDGPLTLSIKAERVGDSLFGSAQCAYDNVKHETTVKGRWRQYPFAIHAERTPREVKYDVQPEPALVELAKKEAQVPIRPGEPGGPS
jgi:hypothetical protein